MPSQAEIMIRRVSPEGRAKARQELERRRRANYRIAGRTALTAAAIVLIALLVDHEVAPLGSLGWILVFAALVGAGIATILLSRDRPIMPDKLATTSLSALPARSAAWIEQQQPSLPTATVGLTSSIAARLGDMEPQLRSLDPASPGADAVRRLIATDLPALVRGYRDVPQRMRSRPRDGGQSADEQLIGGLAVIDGEIGRMTEQLARGAFDELATQRRFLELKYEQ